MLLNRQSHARYSAREKSSRAVAYAGAPSSNHGSRRSAFPSYPQTIRSGVKKKPHISLGMVLGSFGEFSLLRGAVATLETVSVQRIRAEAHSSRMTNLRIGASYEPKENGG